MSGWQATRRASVTRQFHVYFDVTGASGGLSASFAPPTFTNLITLDPNATDEGFDSFRMTLQDGVALDFHKLGGGFSSVVDAGGNDWVSWNSADGTDGDSRGIPNLVHPNDGGHFHPGRTNGSSTLLHDGPLKVSIRAVSDPAGWEALWEIYPTYARMTVLQAATTYWFQYEGTPGGLLESTDLVTRPDGTQNGALESWDGDLPGEEWAYISDPALSRSLFVVHEEEDSLSDTYRDLNDAMTIMSFGRGLGNSRYLTDVPQHFIFGLIDETGYGPMTTAIHSAYKPLSVTAGASEMREDTPPTATPTPTSTPTSVPTSTSTPTPDPPPEAAVCLPPLPLDQWERHVIDANRPGRASFMFDMDVNQDGLTDFITGMYWYENPGTPGGSWTRHLIGSPLQDTIGMYDFDGDGDQDLLGTAGSTAPPPGGVWVPLVWARNDGPGSFTVLENIADDLAMNDNDPIQGVTIARFTPGGPIEIAATWDDAERPARNPSGIQMFTVPADPSTDTWTRRKISDFALGEELAAVDLDNDGDKDLMLGTSWLQNEAPQDTWTPFTLHTEAGLEGDRIELVDLDEDGVLDLVIGFAHASNDHPAKVSWFERTSDVTQPWAETDIFTITTAGPNGTASSLDVADMDGDGDPDVIMGEYRVKFGEGEEPANLWLLENLGQGASWQAHLIHNGDSHYQSSRSGRHRR